MMAVKKETADQMLLKMIENSSPTGPSSAASKAAAQKRTFLGGIKTINNFLILAIVFTVGFLAMEVTKGMRYSGQGVTFQDYRSPSLDLTQTVQPVIQDLAHYLSGVKKRNIFQPYESEKSDGKELASEGMVHIAKKIQHLRLVGIAWHETVETASVMLEDKEKSMTYFLQQGEKIGEIFVKTIYADSALLGYENEEMLIRYDKSQM